MTNKLFMLSIVIPTYNESEIIEESVKEILKLKNIELIISDGGSTDNTLLKIKMILLLQFRKLLLRY